MTNESPLSGICHLYAHIPFCPAKCEYCAFVTHVGSLKLVEPYLKALKLEAKRLRERHPGGPLRTVYLGGGTPSLLEPAQVNSLLVHLTAMFGVMPDLEVTLEAHPGTIDVGKLRGFREAGVTRLSFGAESLNDHELRELGRKHDAACVLNLVRLARSLAFRSLNVDLMYGIPHQTLESWGRSLDDILAVKPDHLSLYPLSIEPKTVFARKWKQNSLTMPEDQAVAQMYHLACQKLRDGGYDHYEVANWALPGHKCRHNLAYWHNQQFYAIGVGAHGYLAHRRTENRTSTKRYIDQVGAGGSAVEAVSQVDEKTEFSETVMLRLRLLDEGLDLDELRERFGNEACAAFGPTADDLEGAGLLHRSARRIRLRESAVPVANEVWQRFL